jgi:hypothetical protein
LNQNEIHASMILSTLPSSMHLSFYAALSDL